MGWKAEKGGGGRAKLRDGWRVEFGCVCSVRIRGFVSPVPTNIAGRATSRVRGLGPMKKLLLLGLVATGGFLVYKQVKAADKSEQDLWTEATDPVPAASRS